MFKKAIFSYCLILIALITRPAFAYDLTAVQNILNPRESKTISMDFKDAALADVLKIFSQQSGLNFIAASDISGKKINLYLDRVPVEEALERILLANNLTYEIKPDSNIFLVKALIKSDKDLMTRIYPLKFATVGSSKVNNTFSSTSSSGGTGAATSTVGGGGSSGIMNSIKALMTADGSVVEDNRTNSLIVTDVPSQFPLIEQVLSKLDIRIPQILIEVEMLDISKNTADLLGAKWGGTFGELTGSSKLVAFPFNPKNGFQTKDKIHPEEADEGVTTYYNSLGNISFTNFKLALEFLNTQNDTKSLARPRILTLNNETAEIKIQTDEAIQIDSKTDAETNETTTTVTRSNTGVSLRVTPQANLLTNEITLAVEPTVVEAKPSSLISSSVQIKDPEVRGSKSMLRVKNGDTVVIGGLLRTDAADSRTSVPGVSRIPIVGAAFRHKDKKEQQRELIIFITPHIVDDNIESADTASSTTILDREQSISTQDINQLDREISNPTSN